jgi:hypothetical protein
MSEVEASYLAHHRLALASQPQDEVVLGGEVVRDGRTSPSSSTTPATAPEMRDAPQRRADPGDTGAAEYTAGLRRPPASGGEVDAATGGALGDDRGDQQVRAKQPLLVRSRRAAVAGIGEPQRTGGRDPGAQGLAPQAKDQWHLAFMEPCEAVVDADRPRGRSARACGCPRAAIHGGGRMG